MKRILCAMCVAVCAATAAAAPAAGQKPAAAAAKTPSWPQWLGPTRDGISTEAAWNFNWPAEGPKKLWEANVGKGYATVTVRGGKVYTVGTAGGEDTVWCLDAATGKEIWKFSYPVNEAGIRNPGARNAPTLDGPYAYTFSVNGLIHCLDADTGKVVWKVDSVAQMGAKGSQHGMSCHPLVLGRAVLYELGCPAGSVVAFDKTNGKVIWQSGRHPVGLASPTAFNLGNRTILLVFTADGLAGMDAQNGRELWFFPCRIGYGNAVGTPMVRGDLVYISSFYYGEATLLRAGPQGVQPVWHCRELRNHIANSMIVGAYAYGFDGRIDQPARGGGFRCVDMNNGQVRWSTEELGIGTLMAAGDKLLVMSSAGELAVVKAAPESFQVISRAKVLQGTCWTMPVLCGGRIYCRNLEGTLLCLDVSPAKG